jgi:hypothetical protein
MPIGDELQQLLEERMLKHQDIVLLLDPTLHGVTRRNTVGVAIRTSGKRGTSRKME